MNKFKNLKVLSIVFLVFLLLLVGFDFSNAANRTVKILKDVTDTLSVAGDLVVGKDVIIKGKVGIGTTTPSAKLEVVGQIRATEGTSIYKNTDYGSNPNTLTTKATSTTAVCYTWTIFSISTNYYYGCDGCCLIIMPSMTCANTAPVICNNTFLGRLLAP